VFLSEAADRQMEFQVQFLEVQASQIAQLDMLEVLPSCLDRVEVWA
jgi:hypothetical protein